MRLVAHELDLKGFASWLEAHAVPIGEDANAKE